MYIVNHDVCCKSRLVDDGHLTYIPVEIFYSCFSPSVVYDSLYFLLISIKWKHGLQILKTHTLRQRHLRMFTSYQGLNLVIDKATFSLLSRHYMVSNILDFDSMKGFLVVLEVWGSSCESWNLTSGY